MSGQSLWDNPMVDAAKKALSSEDLERLKKKGEDLYSIDFEKSGDKGTVVESSHPLDTDVNSEVLQQLVLMLNSGMHPSFFTKDEKEFLKNSIGDKWYEDFGYLENDLHRVNM